MLPLVIVQLIYPIIMVYLRFRFDLMCSMQVLVCLYTCGILEGPLPCSFQPSMVGLIVILVSWHPEKGENTAGFLFEPIQGEAGVCSLLS